MSGIRASRTTIAALTYAIDGAWLVVQGGHFGTNYSLRRQRNDAGGLLVTVGAKWGLGFLYLLLAGLTWFAIDAAFFDWPVADDYLFLEWRRQFFEGDERDFAGILRAHNGPHPMAVVVLVSGALFKMFNLHFTVIVFANFVLIAGMSLLVFDAARTSMRHAGTIAWLLVMCFLVAFHPTQTNHILWPFEISWYLIFFVVAYNVWLVERVGLRAIPWMILAALIASFSSAHGIWAWIAVGCHILLRLDWTVLRRYTGFLLCLIGFLVTLYVVLLIVEPDVGERRLNPSSLMGYPFYLLSLIGGMFGIRDHRVTAVLGGATVLAVLWCAFQSLRHRGAFLPANRVGLVLMLNSALMLATFSFGRYHFGLDWAFASFHAAPLIMPMLLGICVFSIGMSDVSQGTRRQRAVPVLLIGFVLAGFVSSLGYAVQKGRDVLLQRALAMQFNCSTDSSPYLRAAISGLATDDMLVRNQGYLRHLCTDQLPRSARKLLTYPPLFSAMAQDDPAAAAPLRKLWEVYLTHFDLMRAFDLSDSSSAKALLLWARQDAKTGSRYAPGHLGEYAAYFRELNDL